MGLPDRSAGTQCLRCGTCCVKGGPTLHKEDSRLVLDGPLERGSIYTLRAGEVVRDLDGRLVVLETEIVKIKGKAKDWTCVYYREESRACGIYDDRPAECRALKCWDHRDLKAVMDKPRLCRSDLIRPGDGMLRIVAAHEERCSVRTLRSLVKRLDGPDAGGAAEAILDLLTYDQAMRPLLGQKLGIAHEEMDFLLGRPMATLIRMFGLRVQAQGDRFFLSPETEKDPNHYLRA